MAQVKTYRVLRDGLRVGNSVRNFGDFLPEAAKMSTLRTLLNSNVIEEVFVEKEQFEEWEQDQKERDENHDGVVDEINDPEDEVVEPAAVKEERKPKVKKTTKKKKTVKKKGNNNGKQLSEEAV